MNNSAGATVVRTLPLGPDVELRVAAIEDAAPAGRPVLDLRLMRRTPAGADADASVGGGWTETNAGLRCPLHLAALLVEAIERVTRQANQAALWRAPAPPSDGAR